MKVRGLKMNEIYSFEKVNYLFRTKKQIERKIFIEIFQNLRFGTEIKLDEYHYVGFGSIYYYDFILFNKYLNINNMTSIDFAKRKARLNFNKPFDFISFVNKKSTDFLAEKNFEEPTIIWLDYDNGLYNFKDKQLNDYIFNDISIIASKAKPRDFYIITLDIRYPKYNLKKEVYNSLSKFLSEAYRSFKMFKFDEYSYIIQNVFVNNVKESLKYTGLNFYKLFAFKYNDGTDMLTIGGVFDKNDEFQKQQDGHQFINIENYITDIDVPILTYKEKRYLDEKITWKHASNQITDTELDDLLSSIEFEIEPKKLLANYFNFYRFYPQYYEGVL